MLNQQENQPDGTVDCYLCYVGELVTISSGVRVKKGLCWHLEP